MDAPNSSSPNFVSNQLRAMGVEFMYSDDSDDDLFDLMDGAELVAAMNVEQIERFPCRTSKLAGSEWVDELINGNPTRIYDVLRMNVGCFLKLCDVLRQGHYLRDSYKRKVKIEEAVAIFLYTIGHNERQRVSAERFQHSTETINRHVRQVMRAIVKLAKEMIVPPDFHQTHLRIMGDSKFYPYFKDCVGALDGTTVSAHAPANRSTAFRSRKSEICQNVLAVCDFDMYFTYVESGWEGSVNDSRVILDALARPEMNFPMPPPGKYYLVDSAYTNMTGFLAPYRGSRYHLQEFRGSRRGPRSRVELFNYRHSSLRNVIERTFGVLKSRFAILTGKMPNYMLTRQCQIVIACCCIHNFIRKYVNDDPWFQDMEDPNVVLDTTLHEHAPENAPNNVIVSQDDIVVMGQLRDTIAGQIWDDIPR